MLFYSQVYLFAFLPIVLFLFYFNKFIKIDHRYVLIFCSIIFYSWWNIYYLPLIIFSITINYYFCKTLITFEQNKFLLFYAILFNVLILIIFKYTDFIIVNINYFCNTNLQLLNIPFPLALSFITFQIITFLVNCFDKEISEIKFKDFFLFIIFFPQLIAGPIVKYKYMHPQFINNKILRFNYSNFILGLVILFIGLVKKLIFADTLGNFVDFGYQNTENLSTFYSWILSFSFTFQLYFDFSGYIDMATGSALMLNIFLPKNFNSPYKSLSVIDFWQRWHITLSEFLTNFIYMPWAKSIKKLNFLKSMFLIIIVFLIAGIWHGASWCFVLFGLTHGVGLVVNHFFKRFNFFKINKLVSWFFTFNFINISFIFFRSDNFIQSLNLLKSMFILNLKNESSILLNFNNFNDVKFVFIFILSFLICLIFKNSSYLIEKYREIK